MFLTKKKKITHYLQSIPYEERTAFEMLIADYLDGTFKSDLQALGASKLEIYIDWQKDHKCIGVQGKCKNYYMDLQIYPDDFTIAFDLDEADEDTEYPLISKEQLYDILADTINHLV